MNGVDLNPAQDTPVATRKEDTYIHFSVDVEIQRHVEKLPKGEEQGSQRVYNCLHDVLIIIDPFTSKATQMIDLPSQQQKQFQFIH